MITHLMQQVMQLTRCLGTGTDYKATIGDVDPLVNRFILFRKGSPEHSPQNRSSQQLQSLYIAPSSTNPGGINDSVGSKSSSIPLIEASNLGKFLVGLFCFIVLINHS
jgi:hypothetical protein